MDKKKVIELLKKAKDNLTATNMGILYVDSIIEKVLEELQKSDWISVEDDLPPYEEKVLVCGQGIMTDNCFVTMRYPIGRKIPLDKNGFISGLYVTHWRKIDKLEV